MSIASLGHLGVNNLFAIEAQGMQFSQEFKAEFTRLIQEINAGHDVTGNAKKLLALCDTESKKFSELASKNPFFQGSMDRVPQAIKSALEEIPLLVQDPKGHGMIQLQYNGRGATLLDLVKDPDGEFSLHVEDSKYWCENPDNWLHSTDWLSKDDLNQHNWDPSADGWDSNSFYDNVYESGWQNEYNDNGGGCGSNGIQFRYHQKDSGYANPDFWAKGSGEVWTPYLHSNRQINADALLGNAGW